MEKLSDAEYRTMFQLLLRHSQTEMDQFDLWKLKVKYGKVYITIASGPYGEDKSYDDMTHMLT